MPLYISNNEETGHQRLSKPSVPKEQRSQPSPSLICSHLCYAAAQSTYIRITYILFSFFFPKAQSLSRKLFYIRVHILDWGTAAHLKVATVKSALYCDAFWLTCYHKHILKMHYRILKKNKKSFITIAVGRLSVQQPTKTTRIISLTAS